MTGRKRFIAIACVLVTSGAIVYVVHLGRTALLGRLSNQPLPGMGYLGQRLAAEVEKHLPARSSVVLIEFDLARYGLSDESGSGQAFREAARNLNIMATERILPRREDGQPAESYAQISASGFRQPDYRMLVSRYPQAAAFVSLVGAPRVTLTEVQDLPKQRPQIFAIEQQPLKPAEVSAEWCAAGNVELLIVPQDHLEAGANESGATFEWMGQDYQVFTIGEKGRHE